PRFAGGRGDRLRHGAVRLRLRTRPAAGGGRPRRARRRADRDARQPHRPTLTITQARAYRMAHQVRRIVTGFGPDGRSRVTFDSAARPVLPIAGWEGAFVPELRTTEEMPVDNEGDAD